jgi:hypothetical protein
MVVVFADVSNAAISHHIAVLALRPRFRRHRERARRCDHPDPAGIGPDSIGKGDSADGF